MERGAIGFDLRGIAGQLKERRLAVPIYQRSYAWTDEEVGEFWADLRQAFAQEPSEYFLGTIVLTKGSAGNPDTIIDGQQRLATTAILMAAVRDEYRDRRDEKRGGNCPANVPVYTGSDHCPRNPTALPE